MRIPVTATLAAALLAACVAAAPAQTYPTREMRVVVGLPAGSGGDVVARYYADRLSQLAGKPVIVENKPGMILSIGADAVAKAPPDGYTILITSVTSSHAANLFMFKKLPYDPIKDFTPVATLQRSYFILMVREQAPWKTVAELTEAMKAKGNKASYGYGSPPALASAELYKARAGLQAVGVPYRTSMASLPEMFSGELDSSSSTRRRARRCCRPARSARWRSRPAGGFPASICRPWLRLPTSRSSTSRRPGACSCRPARRQRS